MNVTFSLLMACWLLTLPVSRSNGVLNAALSQSYPANQDNEVKQEQEAIFVATNRQRARKRLAPLKKEPKLMRAAQAYADLMAARDQMSHTIGGLTLADKAKVVGYEFRLLSENIALNSRLAGDFVVGEQWMKSTGHRKNLLASDITNIGIGIAGPSKKNRYYYCQLFGTPK